MQRAGRRSRQRPPVACGWRQEAVGGEKEPVTAASSPRRAGSRNCQRPTAGGSGQGEGASSGPQLTAGGGRRVRSAGRRSRQWPPMARSRRQRAGRRRAAGRKMEPLLAAHGPSSPRPAAGGRGWGEGAGSSHQWLVASSRRPRCVCVCVQRAAVGEQEPAADGSGPLPRQEAAVGCR